MRHDEKILRNSQKLRRNMTKEERHLWYDYLKSYPVQFKRQFPIGAYIVDFYCHGAKLVVELDGSQHCTPKEMEYDRAGIVCTENIQFRCNADVSRSMRNHRYGGSGPDVFAVSALDTPASDPLERTLLCN